MSTTEAITLGLAVWGAGLSTILGIRQVWRDRPSLKVQVSQLGSQGPDGDDYRTYLWVRVVNVRARPIEVTKAALQTKRMRRYLAATDATKWSESTELPVRLEDHERADLYYDIERLELHDDKLKRVWVTDSLGREYNGRQHRYTPKQIAVQFYIWRTLRKELRSARR